MMSPVLIVDRRGEASHIPLIPGSSAKKKQKVKKKVNNKSKELFLVGWQVYHLQKGYLLIIKCLGHTEDGAIEFLVSGNGKQFVLPVTVDDSITLIKRIY